MTRRVVAFVVSLLSLLLCAVAYAAPASPARPAGAFVAGLLAWLWALANSPLGLMLIGTLAAAAWARGKKLDKRVETVGRLAVEAFAVAEKKGLIDKLPGAAKWAVFLKTVVDAMRAEGLGDPTPAEAEALKLFAERKSVLAKDV